MTKEQAADLAAAILAADAGLIEDTLMACFPEAPPVPVDPNAGRCKSNMWTEKTGNLRCLKQAGHLPLIPCDFGLKEGA